MVFAADDVARRIVDDLGTVETLALQKLLYYSQGWYLAATGERLFSNTLRAFRQGPVVEAVWRQHSGATTVSAWPTGDAGRLSQSAAAIIDLVCAEYGGRSGWDLAQQTHTEAPWIEARAGLPEDARGWGPIDTDSMARCFREQTLGGYRASDLAVGVATREIQERFGGSGAHAEADRRDFANVVGRARREVPDPAALMHLDYPLTVSRIRPARAQ